MNKDNARSGSAFTMQVILLAKSPVYTVKEAKPAYVITMNYLILQIYPFYF